MHFDSKQWSLFPHISIPCALRTFLCETASCVQRVEKVVSENPGKTILFHNSIIIHFVDPSCMHLFTLGILVTEHSTQASI